MRVGRQGVPGCVALGLDAGLSDHSILIMVDNVERTHDIALRLLTPEGTVIEGMRALGSDTYLFHRATDPFVLEVASGATSGEVEQMYHLRVIPFGNVELEPSNTFATSTLLGTLAGTPLRGYGNTANSTAATDYRVVLLGTPLAAGEAVEVRWRHLNLRTSANLTVEVLNSSEISLARSVQVAGIIAVGNGDIDSLYVTVRGANANRWDPYELEINRIAAWAEVEPNNTIAEATMVAVPGTWVGQGRRTDVDVFAFELPTLSPSEQIQVIASPTVGTRDLTLRLLDELGAAVAWSDGALSASGLYHELTFDPPDRTPGTTYFIEVTPELSSTTVLDAYRLQVEVVDPGL